MVVKWYILEKQTIKFWHVLKLEKAGFLEEKRGEKSDQPENNALYLMFSDSNAWQALHKTTGCWEKLDACI